MSARTILRAGQLEVHLLPSAGGSVARFDRIVEGVRRPLFRGTDSGEARALDCGCFPLVPFCNRIRGGEFECDGRLVRLTPNMPPDPSPLHGQGWLAPWQLDGASDDRAAMTFGHAGAEWPWDYQARLEFELDAAGLAVKLSCRNTSEARMPCGLGLHPYFPCDPETVLDAEVDCAWTIDDHVLPVDNVPAQGQYGLRQRRICAQGLDNGFGGWAGSAELTWPQEATSLCMSSADATFFQVYSPVQGGLVVAEPVQHANAALNAPQNEWEGLGIAMLAPGDERSLLVRFEVVEP